MESFTNLLSLGTPGLLFGALFVFGMSISSFGQVEDYATDMHLSPQVKMFLKGLNTGGPGLETLTPPEAQMVLVNAQKSVKVDLSGVDVSEKTISVDGFSIKLNLVRPAGVKTTLPVFIFIHGGGWVLGDFPTHERMVRDLVVLSGCAAVFVNYTRTPEAKFPRRLIRFMQQLNGLPSMGKKSTLTAKGLG